MLADLGRHGDALRDLDVACRLAPDRSDLWCSCAEVLLQAERVEEALDATSRALALDPQNAAARLIRILSLEDLGRDSEALSEYEGLLQEHPEDEASIRLLRALGHLERGKLDEAIADCDQAELLSDLDVHALGANWIRMAAHERRGDDAMALSDKDAVNEIFSRLRRESDTSK